MRHSKTVGAGLLTIVFVVAHIVATIGLLGEPQADRYSGGWEADEASLAKSCDPYMQSFIPEWNGMGEGQTRLIYKDWQQVYGKPYIPRNQGQAPSCVGQATAAAADFLAAVQIRAGWPERGPPGQAAACCVYGLSRVEIGGSGGSGGGSYNIWACRALKEYGVIPRLNYPLLGVDLRTPSSARAIEYGRTGVPLGLEEVAKLHPIHDYVSIDSYEEGRDALYNGCPIVVGSSQGFGQKDGARRDKDGFLSPPGWWKKSVWRHSMCVIGVCDEGRKGVLIINSWGSNWISGPKRFGDEPDGTFWVDAKVIDSMFKQGDSYAIRGFKGYPNYKLWGQK